MAEGKHGESISHVENLFYVSAHKHVSVVPADSPHLGHLLPQVTTAQPRAAAAAN